MLRVFLHPKLRFRTDRAFSLIELLVVISIIGIMAALLTPALNGFGRSLAVTSAGNTVTNLVALARQTAMTKNTLTALVLLTDQKTTDDYRAFTVLEFHAAVGSKPGTWWQISNWETLPEGTVVDRTDTVTNSSFLANSPVNLLDATEGELPVMFRGAKVTSDAFVARIFTSSGRLQDTQNGAQIRIVEGYNQKPTTIYTHPDKKLGGPANYFDLAILSASGGVKIVRP